MIKEAIMCDVIENLSLCVRYSLQGVKSHYNEPNKAILYIRQIINDSQTVIEFYENEIKSSNNT